VTDAGDEGPRPEGQESTVPPTIPFAVDRTPAPYSHFLAWLPMLFVCAVLLFWIYHAIRWPRRLSIVGTIVNLGLVLLTLTILSDYFRLLLEAETRPVEIVQKNARRSSSSSAQRPGKGGEGDKDCWLAYVLPTGKTARERVDEYDFEAVRVGDHVPLQWLPDDPARSTLGDAAPVGALAWVFALLVAGFSALLALGSGIGLDARNEKADLLAAQMGEEGLPCPHCGDERKDHTFHRRDRLAYAYFFVCEACGTKFGPEDFGSPGPAPGSGPR
jgi:hypothetical protein